MFLDYSALGVLLFMALTPIDGIIAIHNID